ncbi:FHA domain-containing protein [Leifsonia sp. NPDC058292]|uniref:FHA domain-containing protein n=1 Tax=Leifsonia sp. NPDC058292 TaxID=3346428 RepID=UPI0036DE71CC
MTPGFTRYTPADGSAHWLFVAGKRFVAAFESSVSDAIVDAVWWLAELELATIESVVGAFPLTGEDAVRSFAVAELGEQNAAHEIVVTAVVRGSAVVDVFSVGGSRRFAAGGVQPWVLAEFRSVTGLVLGGDELPTGPSAQASGGSLPLGSGIVDGELLVWSAERLAREARKSPRAVKPVAPLTGSDSGADRDTDETIIRPRRSSSLFAHSDELPSPAVDIEPPPDTPLDTPLQVRPPIVEDGFPPTQPVAVVPAPAAFAIRLASGDRFTLDLPVLIGRRPTPMRVTSGAQPRLIAVPSPDNEVSSTHLQIEQVGDAVVVTDLRSTNGTTVSPPHGESTRLRPGQSAVVLPGAVVDIGDGNIIEITAAGGEP